MCHAPWLLNLHQLENPINSHTIITFHQENENYQVEKVVFYEYLSQFSMHTKTRNCFPEKGLNFSKVSFLNPYNALASQRTIFLKVGENCFCGGHFPLENATS